MIMEMDFENAGDAAKYTCLFDEQSQMELLEIVGQQQAEKLQPRETSEATLRALLLHWERLSDEGEQFLLGAAMHSVDRMEPDYRIVDEIILRLNPEEIHAGIKSSHGAYATEEAIGRYWKHMRLDDARDLLDTMSDWRYIPYPHVRNLGVERLVEIVEFQAALHPQRNLGDEWGYTLPLFYLHLRDPARAKPYKEGVKHIGAAAALFRLFVLDSDEEHAKLLESLVSTKRTKKNKQLFEWTICQHYPPTMDVLGHMDPEIRLDFVEQLAHNGLMLTELTVEEVNLLLFPCSIDHNDRVGEVASIHRRQRKIIGLDKPSRDQKEDETIASAA